MTIDTAPVGLRERKRLATRRAIQLAVLDLVSERGLDGVTVDEISRVADISPRTFFNYFGSKEEAMLGDAPELPSRETVESFIASRGPLLDDVRDVLVGSGDVYLDDAEMLHRRHTLVRQYPQLFAMRMASMRKFEDELAAVITRRIRSEDPAVDLAWAQDRARLLTFVSFAAMRHAWIAWAAGESTADLGQAMRKSFSELKTILAS